MFAGRLVPDARVYQERGRKAGDAGGAKERPRGRGRSSWSSPTLGEPHNLRGSGCPLRNGNSDINLSVSAGGGVCHVGDSFPKRVILVPLEVSFLFQSLLRPRQHWVASISELSRLSLVTCPPCLCLRPAASRPQGANPPSPALPPAAKTPQALCPEELASVSPTYNTPSWQKSHRRIS